MTSQSLRLGLAALLAAAGLGLIVYGAVSPEATAAMETGKWLLLGSPLTAWAEGPAGVPDAPEAPPAAGLGGASGAVAGPPAAP